MTSVIGFCCDAMAPIHGSARFMGQPFAVRSDQPAKWADGGIALPVISFAGMTFEASADNETALHQTLRDYLVSCRHEGGGARFTGENKRISAAAAGQAFPDPPRRHYGRASPPGPSRASSRRATARWVRGPAPVRGHTSTPG